MRILYIFSHPDDESYGPACVMHKQIREGHKVFLLTLTKGGAAKQRLKLNLSVEEMGEIRFKEILNASEIIGLSGLNVLNFEYSRLKETDPRIIETQVINEINKILPDVVVTYPVHGISGFEDHLITHSVVKRGFVEARQNNSSLKRLAFFTLTEEQANSGEHFSLKGSGRNEIDCIIEVTEDDIEINRQSIDCYSYYKDLIEKTNIKNRINRYNAFEFFMEDFSPPVDDIFSGL